MRAAGLSGARKPEREVGGYVSRCAMHRGWEPGEDPGPLSLEGTESLPARE